MGSRHIRICKWHKREIKDFLFVWYLDRVEAHWSKFLHWTLSTKVSAAAAQFELRTRHWQHEATLLLSAIQWVSLEFEHFTSSFANLEQRLKISLLATVTKAERAFVKQHKQVEHSANRSCPQQRRLLAFPVTNVMTRWHKRADWALGVLRWRTQCTSVVANFVWLCFLSVQASKLKFLPFTRASMANGNKKLLTPLAVMLWFYGRNMKSSLGYLNAKKT